MNSEMSSMTIEKLLRVFAGSPGYLQESGWLNSMEKGEAVDKEGRPIPWITYPALDFLTPRPGHRAAWAA